MYAIRSYYGQSDHGGEREGGMIKSLDPRMKLLSIIVITTMALLFFDMLWMLGLSLAALLLNVLLGADFTALFRRMRRFTQLLLIIALVQIVFVV